MKKPCAWWLFLVFTGGCVSHQIKTTSGSAEVKSRSIAEIGNSFFDFILTRDPFYATFIGDHRYDHLVPKIDADEREQNYTKLLDFKAELADIDQSRLSHSDRISYDFLHHEITTRIGMESCNLPLWSVDQLDGPQIAFMELAKNHRLKEPRDLANLIKRFRQAESFFRSHIENLRLGRKRGLVAAKINILHVIEQLEHQLAHEPEKSAFFIPYQDMPKSWPKSVKDELARELRASIISSVLPGLMAYRDYLKYELLPDANQAVGIHALPTGKACYQSLIERHTGFKKSAHEIHAEGLNEVQRIKLEMRKLLRAHTDYTDEKIYMEKLKNDPAQYLKTADELISHNQELVARAQHALPKAFGNLPKTKIVVMPLQGFKQKHAPVAYYYEAPGDDERPAYYYLNTYRPEIRPLYNMAALAFHEAVPGHHLQIALANENASIPRFQRHLGQTSFVEGWALYAEILARELGLYHNVEEMFGSLNYELWRALRLVIDTGIHDQGWSRDHATQYLVSNTALTHEEVSNEIDRYIVWPGQALAYKLGQMEISHLRAKSERELGAKFSLIAFHDHVLKNGAMPMISLRRATERWIDAQKSQGETGASRATP